MEYRKKPVRARSHDTIDIILDATLELLRKQEFETLSTNGIAKRAGVGIGTLYLYFTNKEQIVLTLIEREYDKQFERIQKVMDGVQVEPTTAYLNRFFAAVLDTEQLKNVIMFLNYLPILERCVGKKQISMRIKHIIYTALSRIKYLDLSEPRVEIMVGIIYELIRSVIAGISLSPEMSDEERNKQHQLLISELTKVITSYISQAMRFAESG